MLKDDYINKMREGGCDEVVIAAVEPLIQLAEPCFAIVYEDSKDCELGCSKMGGVPDLPAGSSWPESNSEPDIFLFQVNLQELNEIDVEKIFPKNGLLSFFVSEDQRTARVLYSPDSDNLIATPIHEMLPEMDVPETICLSFKYYQDCVPPPYDSEEFQKLDLTIEQKYSFEDFEYELKDELVYLESRLLGPLLDGFGGGDKTDRVSIELRSRKMKYTSLAAEQVEEAAKSWRLLAVIDPSEFESPLSSLSSLGRRLFFWIKEEDLKKKHFGKAQVVLGES